MIHDPRSMISGLDGEDRRCSRTLISHRYQLLILHPLSLPSPYPALPPGQERGEGDIWWMTGDVTGVASLG
jgi:hypothetical protein